MSEFKESLTLSKNTIKGAATCYTGKSGEFYVSIIPSLNVSGYGETQLESLSDANYNLKIFLNDLIEIDLKEREKYIISLGWERSPMVKKRFSSSFIDTNGVLQNFDTPKEVKQSMCEVG